jgi:deoxyribonuclease V
MREGLKVCVDVDYREDCVVAAGVGFAEWGDAVAVFETTRRFVAAPADYESGQFYKREMPYLLQLLGGLEHPPALVIIDGFVWLDGGRAGLGAHLAEALVSACPVIGVAKRPFHEAANAAPLLRGTSQVPLFVSAVGVELLQAVSGIAQMHGPHRVPTLLRRVDQLSREAARA